MAFQPIYQFHAELLDYRPKIWRRFQVPGNITMAKLGYILMSIFEMKASHLFCFNVPAELKFKEFIEERLSKKDCENIFKKIDVYNLFIKSNWRFEIIKGRIENFSTEGEESEKFFDASKSKLKDAVWRPFTQMFFTYDYGDDWNIYLVLEEIIVDKELSGRELPRVLAGEGFGIIEDCGGTFGLEEIAEAFKKKKGERYDEFCEWLGRNDLDMDAFDIDDANLRLKKVPRIYADIYEHDMYPTQQSIDFLERKYIRN